MKLHVLGRYGPYPAPGGACSGYLLEQGETRILIDCGSGVFSRMLQFTDFESVTAVILSHLHSDHMADLLIMRYAKDIRKKPLTIYAPCTPAETYDQLSREVLFDVRPVSENLSVDIGAVHAVFCGMTHPVESYAVRLTHNGTSIVFSGDTNYNEKLAPFAQGASFFLCDAAFLEPEKKPGQNVPHLTAREAGRIASEANVDFLALTHIRAAHTPQEYAREAALEHAHAAVAEEGKTYII
ncbi:MAG: MBL fold metallo-hydrolase [Bacillota bacterium]